MGESVIPKSGAMKDLVSSACGTVIPMSEAKKDLVTSASGTVI